MLEKVRSFWEDLDITVKVNKRELVLGAAVCTLAGLVAGMLASPRKNVTMGSHNAYNNVADKGCEEVDEEEVSE